jgi:hypothetical protein
VAVGCLPSSVGAGVLDTATDARESRLPFGADSSGKTLLAGRARQRAHLLQHARDVGYRPVFDDFAVANAVDRDPVSLDFLVRRWDPEKFARVHAATNDATHDEVAFGYLHRDFVASGSRDTKDLSRLLHSLAI